jgi:hypothetical protein
MLRPTRLSASIAMEGQERSGGQEVMNHIRSHARPLVAALIIVVVGLSAGLVATNFPTQASSAGGGGGAQAGAAQAGQAYKDYRAAEREALTPPSQQAAQANADYRSGERQYVSQSDATAAWQLYRVGERESLP